MALGEGLEQGGGGYKYKMLSGICPDVACQTKLFFPAHDSSIECTSCGQRHLRNKIKDIEEVTNTRVALHNTLKNLLVGNMKPKRTADSVKVLGFSNYQCKLLSPFLSRYGMDKHTGQAKLLTEMGQGQIFDCGVLGDRAFLIEPDYMDVVGYGRDRTGSMRYLSDTLDAIKKNNDNEERLLPIHADGDGHCLVHAVSRALVGREVFWHALRENLKNHISEKLEHYKNLFRDFVDENEWNDIIAECDPGYLPRDGEAVGLRNIHIFGLANILKRPLILVDSLSGLQSSGDYSGVFLPGLWEPEMCRSKDGTLNKPLCLAWSNNGRNHYIALVAVKGRPLPKLPGWMVPKVWGMPQMLLKKYIDVDVEGCVTIGGDKCLSDKYILRLVNAMEKVFQEKYKICTALVADVNQYVFKSTGCVGVKPEVVTDQTQKSVSENLLYRCLTCDALLEWNLSSEAFQRGGHYYTMAEKSASNGLSADMEYHISGLICNYNQERDELIVDRKRSRMNQCQWCQGNAVRLVCGDGSIVYQNGDKTATRSTSTMCQCGFKHYWDGKEYDNLPERIPVRLEWAGKVHDVQVAWFQYEADQSLNSNVYQVAQQVVQEYFPGEFGSERLVQKVVDTILRITAKPEPPTSQPVAESPMATEITDGAHESTDASWRADSPSKIILTGQKKKTFHKEELTMSASERRVKKNVQDHAVLSQSRKTDQLQRESSAARPASATKSPVGRQNTEGPSSPEAGGDVGSASRAPPGASSAANMTQHKKVRVTTSDGRQVLLSLEPSVTCTALKQQLSRELGVPPQRQKIKHGFPPREIKAPSDGPDEEPLPIQNGDRLTLDILADPTDAAAAAAAAALFVSEELRSPENPWPVQQAARQSWSSFDANSHSQSAQTLLTELESLQNSSVGSLDTSIASLTLLASLGGKDLWSYVQGMPHLFSVGGLFYQQVDRDLGLADGKHCALPMLPGKVFRFNAKDSRLELCLEPHGHFPVEPGIEKRILEGSMTTPGDSAPLTACPEVKALLTSGGSGVVTHGSKKTASHFPGQGHSLAANANENIRMPQDLDLTPHKKNKAMKFHDFTQASPHPNSISEEEEEEGGGSVTMDTDSSKREAAAGNQSDGVAAQSALEDAHHFKRVGPGRTVLNQEVTNDINKRSETFRNIAAQLETMVEETGSLGESVANSAARSIIPMESDHHGDTAAASSSSTATVADQLHELPPAASSLPSKAVPHSAEHTGEADAAMDST